MTSLSNVMFCYFVEIFTPGSSFELGPIFYSGENLEIIVSLKKSSNVFTLNKVSKLFSKLKALLLFIWSDGDFKFNFGLESCISSRI